MQRVNPWIIDVFNCRGFWVCMNRFWQLIPWLHIKAFYPWKMMLVEGRWLHNRSAETHHPLQQTVSSNHPPEKMLKSINNTLPWQCRTPLAVLKIKDSGTAPGHWFFPEVREFSRPISTKSLFRQPGFPWNYLIGSLYHMTLFVGVAVAKPVPVPATLPRFLFSAPLNLLWELRMFV